LPAITETSNEKEAAVLLALLPLHIGRFFDAEGGLMTAVLRRYEQTNYFVPPPEAVSASFPVYSCLLEEVRLVRVGHEEAIDTFQRK